MTPPFPTLLSDWTDAPAVNQAWLPAPVSPSLVTLLQAARGYPCVSLLLSTQPAERMTNGDAARLERLQSRALGRLREEGLLNAADPLVNALDRLVHEAVTSPTDRAVAIYASAAVARSVRLPIEVADREVVDPTFATRDLVRALHRTPRHVVLVLSAHRAMLFDGAGGRLAPVSSSHFPMDLRTMPSGDGTVRLRAVDRALGTYLHLHPSPVVLLGPTKQVAAFRATSRHLQRLAGCVIGSFEHADLEELAARSRPVLERYLTSREEEALALLERRVGHHRVASGIQSAWLAARTERPEMLAVEEGFRYPARLSADDDLVTAALDVEAPDVVDDLVDELIETVLDRGGWVALVRDGSLAPHERVALTLRT